MSNKDDLFNIGKENSQNNMKKILIYVAIGFLVFVIGVIGFAIIQNSNNSEKNAIIPPNTQTQPKQDNLFKQIPIENDNTQQVKPKSQTNIKKVIQNSEQNHSQVIPETQNQNPIQQNKPEIKKEVKPATPSKAKVAKPAVKKVIKPKKPQRTIRKSHKKVINKGKYYIQVAALLRYKKPSKKFLQLITKAGYKYKFFVTYAKLKGEKVKVTKVLAGPFSNRLEAKKALKKVKENITQNAFIFKVK